MVKSVEKAVEEVVNGVKQNLHITLHQYIVRDVKEAMMNRGMAVREHFDGPIFKDIMGYQINGDWIAVSLKDGTTYVYPAKHVARVKHFNDKE